MAIFYPSLDSINSRRIPPLEADLTLINFFKNNLTNDFEIYYKPFINGDNPDFILIRRNHGVLIISSKEWDISQFINISKQEWTTSKYKFKSPLSQLQEYHDNLMNFHIRGLLELRQQNSKNNAIISQMLYLHNTKYSVLNNDKFKEIAPYSISSNKPNIYRKYKCIFSKDDLNNNNFQGFLSSNYIGGNKFSSLFKDDIYFAFKYVLTPTEHTKNLSVKIEYTDEQKKIIYSSCKNAYITGVYGSGKTTTLVATAVQTYIKLKEAGNDVPKILILCYNITLVNWLRYQLNNVNETFDPSAFTFLNYHEFINQQLNNLGEIVYPAPCLRDKNIIYNSEKECNCECVLQTCKLSQEEYIKGIKNLQDKCISRFFSSKYYSNPKLFEYLFSSKREQQYGESNDEFKFDAILIDEIQDYPKVWTQILKNYFLLQNGRFFVFGDEKQNIYNTPLINKKIEVYFGKEKCEKYRLTKCIRSNIELQDLLKKYQDKFLCNKYNKDEFNNKNINNKLVNSVFEFKFIFNNQQKKISYYEINGRYQADKAYLFFNKFLELVSKNLTSVNPEDISIISSNKYLLRFFDLLYKNKTGFYTETSFVQIEDIFFIWLTDINSEIKNHEEGLKFHLKSILKKYNLNQNKIISCALYILCSDYINRIFYNNFIDNYKNICNQYKIDFNEIYSFLSKYNDVILNLPKYILKTYTKDIKTFEKSRKLNFNITNGLIKLSTIHSFKGWESKVTFLIFDESINNSETMNELVYTGLTRSKEQLIIINLGKSEYAEFIKNYCRQ